MKQWHISGFGIDQLELADVPQPAPGPGEVLVRVHATSLNYRDLMMVLGFYNPKLRMPTVPLSDGAGEVVATGDGVTQWKAGDRVAGIFMQNWIDGRPSAEKQHGALGGDVDGMLSEYVALNESGVVRIPDHLSYEEAATLPCAGVTAWNAVVRSGSVGPGDTVLIQGTGGVSIFALQFARSAGARVIGTSSSDEKLKRAAGLGLDAGLNYNSTPDWAAWVREQTGGRGADLVVEVGGPGTFDQSLSAVAVGGTVAQIGVLSQSQQPVDVRPMLMRQICVQGIYVGSRADFVAMNRAMEQLKIKPVVDKAFSFDQAREALKHLQSGRHFGKVVVRVQ